MKVACCMFLLISLVLSVSGASIVKKVQSFFSQKPGCTLNAKSDFAKERIPVIIKADSTVHDPTQHTKMMFVQQSVYKLKPNDELTMFCPGSDNLIADYGKQKMDFKCVDGTVLSPKESEDKEIDSRDISCLYRVEYAIKKTNENCNGGGVIADIGFEVDGTHTKVYAVCYLQSKDSNVTYWTRHVIRGDIIVGRAEHIERGPDYYKVGEIEFPIGKANKVEDAYRTNNQNGEFSKSGGALFANYVNFNKKRFVWPTQLTPAEDFVMAFLQQAVYFFVNTAAIWTSIQRGSLLDLEKALRRRAAEKNTTVEVFTGTFGVAKPNDGSQTHGEHEFYLQIEDGKEGLGRIPVPEQLWKLARTEKGECMAFLIINEPYLTQIQGHLLCTDECQHYKWQFKKDFNLGFTYCCKYDNFIGMTQRPPLPELPKNYCRDVFYGKDEVK